MATQQQKMATLQDQLQIMSTAMNNANSNPAPHIPNPTNYGQPNPTPLNTGSLPPPAPHIPNPTNYGQPMHHLPPSDVTKYAHIPATYNNSAVLQLRAMHQNTDREEENRRREEEICRRTDLYEKLFFNDHNLNG